MAPIWSISPTGWVKLMTQQYGLNGKTQHLGQTNPAHVLSFSDPAACLRLGCFLTVHFLERLLLGYYFCLEV